MNSYDQLVLDIRNTLLQWEMVMTYLQKEGDSDRARANGLTGAADAEQCARFAILGCCKQLKSILSKS